MTIDEIMAVQPVIPVITVDRVEDSAPLATALVGSGLRVLEVTLRTPVALACIREMAQIANAVIGAGTVLTAQDVRMACAAGARFIVTPGLSAGTVAAAREMNVPILPGIATATELMAGLDLGISHFKFFPAEQAGGRAMIDAFRGPFGGVRFCPTGGITQELAEEYLRRPNVACVGGGWICPPGLIQANGWETIGALARRAAGLPRAYMSAH